MKTSMVGVVSAAILMILASIGFGIAQAAGTHSEQPVLSFEDQEATQAATSTADDKPRANNCLFRGEKGDFAGTLLTGETPFMIAVGIGTILI